MDCRATWWTLRIAINRYLVGVTHEQSWKIRINKI